MVRQVGVEEKKWDQGPGEVVERRFSRPNFSRVREQKLPKREVYQTVALVAVATLGTHWVVHQLWNDKMSNNPFYHVLGTTIGSCLLLRLIVGNNRVLRLVSRAFEWGGALPEKMVDVSYAWLPGRVLHRPPGL